MAEVTKRHRELAWESCGRGVPGLRQAHWIETGEVWAAVGWQIRNCAQALADIEAEALSAAPQPVKAEQDEREHLRFGATVLRVILQDALERGGEAALVPECLKWLEAERARLSAAVEPKEKP